MHEQTITFDDMLRSKRAFIVLSELAKASMLGKELPLDLRKDMLALGRVLLTLDKL